MDHNLSQVPKKSNTPDTEGHNGYIGKTGIVSQTLVGQSTGSVAIEAVTSVGTSLGSLRASTLSLSVIRAENQDLPPLNVKKGAAESSIVPRKRRRDSYSTSQIPGHPQLAYQKRPLCLIKISRKMVNDTIQYLQMLSDYILICDTISPREWATIYLAT
ncbi:hypothetical protein N7455_004275 [Penicillium solitum]|uniref:uncharacterized protein n=1 Tax=Penicillium solitum TaxID=60172 RepID=UPI0032C4A643|nr:hypothetical protein N7455_004275 [Penicillium solitum]